MKKWLKRVISSIWKQRIVQYLIPDKLFLKVQYRNFTGNKLNLKKPQTFGEKIQWLKLNDRQDYYTNLVDKYKVREFIKKKIGEEYLIPLYGVFNSYDEIDFTALPNEFVLKPNHTSGNVYLCRNKTQLNHIKLKETVDKWLKRNYFSVHREWPYKNIKPKIICEKMLVDNNSKGNITDFKFFCFNGIPKYCQIIRGRNYNETIDFYDMSWRRMPFTGLRSLENSENGVEKPKKLKELIKLSSILSEGIPFVRVDFYYIEERIYFGEITFYPQSGYGSFIPKEWNKKIGDLIDLPKKQYDR